MEVEGKLLDVLGKITDSVLDGRNQLSFLTPFYIFIRSSRDCRVVVRNRIDTRDTEPMLRPVVILFEEEEKERLGYEFIQVVKNGEEISLLSKKVCGDIVLALKGEELTGKVSNEFDIVRNVLSYMDSCATKTVCQLTEDFVEYEHDGKVYQERIFSDVTKHPFVSDDITIEGSKVRIIKERPGQYLQGVRKSPHKRRGHVRKYKSGLEVYVEPSIVNQELITSEEMLEQIESRKYKI